VAPEIRLNLGGGCGAVLSLYGAPLLGVVAEEDLSATRVDEGADLLAVLDIDKEAPRFLLVREHTAALGAFRRAETRPPLSPFPPLDVPHYDSFAPAL
jgi:hypothetical protein